MKFHRTIFQTSVLISKIANALLRPFGFCLSRRTPPLRTTSDILSALLKDKPKAYVIDVGAAIGNFSAEVLQLVPDAKIICIEPLQECQKVLANRFEQSNVTLVQAALGDRDGEVIFHETSGRDSSSALAMERHRDEFPLASREVASYPVRLLKLDTLLTNDSEAAPIDLLKIDTQGYELLVLAGAERTLKRCNFVLVEMSLKPLYHGQAPFEEVILFLHQRGFRIVDYVEGIRSHQTFDLLQMDFLYQRSNVII